MEEEKMKIIILSSLVLAKQNLLNQKYGRWWRDW
jgi:hypothetical protein